MSSIEYMAERSETLYYYRNWCASAYKRGERFANKVSAEWKRHHSDLVHMIHQKKVELEKKRPDIEKLQHAMKYATLGAVLYYALALGGAASAFYFGLPSSWGGGFPTARRDQRREQQNHRTHMRHADRWVGGVLEYCQTLTVAKLSTLFVLKSIEKSLRVDTNQPSRPYVTMQGRRYYILYELLKEGSIETYFPATMKGPNVVASTDSELAKVPSCRESTTNGKAITRNTCNGGFPKMEG
jgi:hypothetical protein